MRTYATVKDYKIDVRGNAILIYTAVQEIDALADLFKDLYPDPTANVELMANLRKVVHYSPMMVFQLVDATRRTFQTQRYCFLGSVDDWIEIGKPGKVGNAGQTVCETSRPGFLCRTLVRVQTGRCIPRCVRIAQRGAVCPHAYLYGTGVMLERCDDRGHGASRPATDGS